MRLGSVGVRSQIGSPGEQQAVEPGDQLRDVRGRQRRHHHRYSAGGLDRPHVRDSERHLRVRRVAVAAQRGEVAGTQLRGRDADERLHALRIGANSGDLYLPMANMFPERVSTASDG